MSPHSPFFCIQSCRESGDNIFPRCALILVVYETRNADRLDARVSVQAVYCERYPGGEKIVPLSVAAIPGSLNKRLVNYLLEFDHFM